MISHTKKAISGRQLVLFETTKKCSYQLNINSAALPIRNEHRYYTQSKEGSLSPSQYEVRMIHSTERSGFMNMQNNSAIAKNLTARFYIARTMTMSLIRGT